MLIADAALTVAFAIIFAKGGFGKLCSGTGAQSVLCLNPFVYFLPISFIAVSLSFILHEYMHKRMAEHFGAIAAFKRSDTGILITLLTSLFGFLIGLPGATMIYTNTFTRKEEGLVSLAGPLTNFAVFGILFAVSLFASLSGYAAVAIETTLYISLWLAFVNMLPVYPLDGSKVLKWNKAVYTTTLAAIFVLLYTIVPSAQLIYSMIIVIILALLFSFLYKGALFRF